MDINIKFLAIAYFISLFVDWVFQWDWQAVNKSRWSKGSNYVLSGIAVATHSLVYTVLTCLPLLFLLDLNYQSFSLIWDALFISHIIIDTRIPVKWIMKFKGMTWEQINDTQTYGFMHTGIDHRLHEMVLLILAFIV
jgi:ABC-type phosphate/phosphonate transport system permease subunit